MQPYAAASVAGAVVAGVLAGRALPTDAVEPVAPVLAPPDATPSAPAVDVDALVRRMSSSSEQAVSEGEQLSSASTDLAGRFGSVSQSVEALRWAARIAAESCSGFTRASLWAAPRGPAGRREA